MARRSRKEVTASGNKSYVIVTLRSVVASRAFGDGVKDYRTGRPWRGDAYPLEHQWGYERGRQFAAIYSGPIKQGRDVLPNALRAYGAAVTLRHIL